ncbi:MAG: SUMF1/EgtB/PvdO family nonheme iron enzyme [Polyangiaceae bacterium]
MRAPLIVLGIGAAGLLLALATRQSDPESPLTPEPPRAGEGSCPAGSDDAGLGPDMLRVPEGFCIDKTEVTRAQYAAWLDTSPSTSGQSSACASNDGFTPSCGWPAGSDGEKPVVCVDWCDASAFCEAAGKRLCGKVGDGGPYAFEDYDDPAQSEWFAACTSGGKYDYTYGSTLDTSVCRDADADDYTQWGLADVGSFPDCHSPDAAYSKLYDLSGHVAEWDQGCQSDDPEAPCRIRGGSYQHHAHGLRCDMGRALEWPRTRQVESVGFRCCAD